MRAAVLLIALLSLVAAAPALGRVAPESIGDRTLVVEAGADQLGAEDLDRLEAAEGALAGRGERVTVVIVADRAQATEAAAARLRREAALPGSVITLFLAEGGGGRIGISSPRAGAADAAFAAEEGRLREDPVGGAIAIAERLSEGQVSSDGGGVSTGGVIVLVLLVGGAGALVLNARKRAARAAERRRREERAALEPVVDALAAKVTGLEGDMPIAPPERAAAARADHDEAVLAYGEAGVALRRADGPGGSASTEAARAALERGLRAAARAEARLEGRSPAQAESEPLLGGLCAFDPQHGRAVGTSTVTTPAGETAEVPVCAACAARLERGEQPDPRLVPADGRMVPYWQGAGLGPGFGGVLFPVLGGLLLYDLLTPGLGFGAGWMGGESDWSGGDYGGGGDFGGGDFGGGGDF